MKTFRFEETPFDRMIEGLFEANMLPYVDGAGIWEVDGDTIIGYIEMPGVKKEDVKLHVEGWNLRVTAKREKPTKRKFEKVFQLGDHDDPDRIEAALQDGILTLKVPKKESVKPKQIEVK